MKVIKIPHTDIVLNVYTHGDYGITEIDICQDKDMVAGTTNTIKLLVDFLVGILENNPSPHANLATEANSEESRTRSGNRDTSEGS